MKKYYLELISFEKKHRKELQKKYPTAKTMTATHPRDGGEELRCTMYVIYFMTIKIGLISYSNHGVTLKLLVLN
jgi:hypothetical protein